MEFGVKSGVERGIRVSKKYPDVGHGVFGNVNTVEFCYEYRLILQEARRLKYSVPSYAQQVKQNKLLIALKMSSIWYYLDIFYIFANNGDSDFGTINWKNPNLYRITKVNTPTFTTNEGYDFNGTTQYLNTNWAPGTNGVNYRQDDASIGVYINDNVASNGQRDFGASNNADGITNGIFMNSRNATNALNIRINDNANLGLGANTDSRGFYHLKRKGTSGTRRYIYKNGTLRNSDSQASTALTTANLFLGVSNGNGTPTVYSTREQSMAWAGASLDGLESIFYTHWNNYFTSL